MFSNLISELGTFIRGCWIANLLRGSFCAILAFFVLFALPSMFFHFGVSQIVSKLSEIVGRCFIHCTFSGTESTPTDELNFDQWCIDVKSYQASYPDNILLPAIRKSIVGKAKSVIRHLSPSYTVDEVITVLTQEYEGVASSDVILLKTSTS